MSQSPTQSPQRNVPPLNESNAKSVNEVYSIIGWGRYQRMLFFFAGCGYAADSIETGLICWINTQAPTTRWPSPWDEDSVKLHLGLLASFVFAGELVSGFIWGPLADRIGRRPVFLISNLCLFTFGIASAFAPTFETFVLARSLVGMSMGGVIVPFDNLAESIEEKDVVQVTYAMNYFWSVGTIFVNVVAALILPYGDFGTFDAWRIMAILCALPMLVAVVGFFFIEESPLWLQDQGRHEEALEVLQRIARKSGKDISDVTLVPYDHEGVHEAPYNELFDPVYRRRTLILAFTWICSIFGYYGGSLATPTIFGERGDATQPSYAPLLFASSGEFFATFVCVMLCPRIGYMRTITLMFSIATVCTAAMLLKSVMPVMLLGIFDFFLRAGCAGGSQGTYVVTPLAYPTHIRATAFGFHYTMGRVGAVLAACVGASFAIQVGMYTIANLYCTVAMYASTKMFERSDELEALREDLCASDMVRRQSSIRRSSKEASGVLSFGTFGEAPSTNPRPSAAWKAHSADQ